MNRHNPWDLRQMQSLPLEAKIFMSERRIEQWYDYWDGEVYVSFSGGKDSTVLADLVARFCKKYRWKMYLLFVNTGLEYPEIQKFVKTFAEWLQRTYGIEVQLDIVRPEMRFDEVIRKYGYPVISKEVSQTIFEARRNRETGKHTYRIAKLNGEATDKDGNLSKYNIPQWKFLMDAPYDISHKCCDVMKKAPAKQYEKRTGRMPFLATMASESRLRYSKWLKFGCNAFEADRPTSQPLSFWTDQDILHYIKKYLQQPLDEAWKSINSPYRTVRKKARKHIRNFNYSKRAYASVYGDICIKPSKDEADGQINMIDYLGCYEPEDTLETTGCDRTGCIFCMFGCHLEKGPNRFQRLKETHPRQYEFCIYGGVHVWEGTAFTSSGEPRKIDWINDDGSFMTFEEIDKFVEENKDNPAYKFKRVWKPSKYGLGLSKVLDYIGVDYK